MAKKKGNPRPFSERHPKLNTLLGLTILGSGTYGAYWLLCRVVEKTINVIKTVLDAVSNMDAVVIVALITGGVSIFGVIVSSVIAKLIDYKKNRQDYLARKREEPYGEFVEMVYKVQKNAKENGTYTNEQMIADISKFSRRLTLWGSDRVVKRWVKFRENGMNPDAGADNLFVMEEIMNEMRKDLGLKKVKKGNLLAFFVNDIKDAMKKGKVGASR